VMGEHKSKTNISHAVLDTVVHAPSLSDCGVNRELGCSPVSCSRLVGLNQPPTIMLKRPADAALRP